MEIASISAALVSAERLTRKADKTTARTQIYQRSFQENQKQSNNLKMARAFAGFLRQKEVIVLENDLLAGHTQHYNYHPSIPVFYPASDNIKQDGFDPAVLPPTKFDVQEEIETYLIDHAHDAHIESDAKILRQFLIGIDIKLYKRWGSGHVIADYEYILNNGFQKIINDIHVQLDAAREDEKRTFLQSALIVTEAAVEYIQRYAEKSKETARLICSDQEKPHLQRISDACEWVARNPPRTFFEAVQLLWLTHEMVVIENFTGSMSIGRLDQYLYPFYEQDTQNGLLDVECAGELIETLWLKFANLTKGYQNVTLAGCRPDGSDATNELSILCLRASRNLRMDQPLLSVRWHPAISDVFWDEALQLIETGIGMPALFNDAVAIAALTNLGIDRQDALNYGIVGCVELSVPGKEYANTEGLRFNWAKVMELVLNSGQCTCTGKKIGLKTNRKLSDFQSFDAFYVWFKDEFRHYLEIGLNAVNLLDANYSNHWPNPFLSSLMQGCIKNSQDVTAGGTLYNLSSANICGVANCADSLFAIKQVIFTEKKASLPELSTALKNDFKDAKQLQVLLSRTRKFGNDHQEVDIFASQLTDLFSSIVQTFDNPRGGKFQVGLYTVSDHAHMGILTGALPDGRHKCVSLANGISPSQGRDALGPTAVIKSVTKIDHTLAGNGVVLDLKFHPDFFLSPKHRQAFRQLIESYFALGGMELQFNVIDRETLILAQKHPQEYRDLIVRVSGFSAYFTTLDKPLQDEIIARTEYQAL